MKTVSTGQVFSNIPAGYEGDSLTCFSHYFFLPSFSPLSWGLSLAKIHAAWLQDLMKLRLLMSHCKNSLRHTDR